MLEALAWAVLDTAEGLGVPAIGRLAEVTISSVVSFVEATHQRRPDEACAAGDQ